MTDRQDDEGQWIVFYRTPGRILLYDCGGDDDTYSVNLLDAARFASREEAVGATKTAAGIMKIRPGVFLISSEVVSLHAHIAALKILGEQT